MAPSRGYGVGGHLQRILVHAIISPQEQQGTSVSVNLDSAGLGQGCWPIETRGHVRMHVRMPTAHRGSLAGITNVLLLVR